MSDIISPLQEAAASDRGALADFSAPPTGEMECPRHPADSDAKSKRGGARPGSGRPRITSERPWQAEGISRSTYCRRLSPQPPTQTIYAVDEPLWRVFATWPQAEIPAASELTRIGYDTYMPLVSIRRRDPVIHTKFNTVLVPHLPGYGLIRLTQRESLEPVVKSPGVREMLRRPDGRLATVPEEQIVILRAENLKRLELPATSGPALKIDTTIRVKHGAFEDAVGVVKECDGVKTRIEINIFGRPTPVWMDRIDVSEL